VPGEFTFGFIYLPAALFISTTSFFTVPLGAKLSHRLPVSVVKKIFGIMLFGLSIKMLVPVL